MTNIKVENKNNNNNINKTSDNLNPKLQIIKRDNNNNNNINNRHDNINNNIFSQSQSQYINNIKNK